MARIVLAMDSLKGSISAARAGAAIADGWASAQTAVEVVHRPMADGGEGTLDALAAAIPGARRMPVTVSGPGGSAVEASWLLIPDDTDTGDDTVGGGGTGVVELASTSGIELLDGQLRPWDADTRGFGEAIAAALDHGVHRLVLGIGSSASTDGGAGVLSALGARLLTADGDAVASGLRGLGDVDTVDLSALRPLPAGGVLVLSDVTSPLTGPTGAAVVFGPQKGLGLGDLVAADAALGRFAERLAAAAGTGAAAAEAAGAGAAGGTGFGLLAWGARLVPGAEEVAELIELPAAIAGADLIITGEGSYDGQSAVGKAPAYVCEAAARAGTPVALVAGRISEDADTSGFVAAVSLTDLAGSGRAAIAEPAHWLRAAGTELARQGL